MKKRGGFFKSNWAYLIWFTIYFSVAILTIYVFTNNLLQSFILTFIIYGTCIAIALSPIGEIILRLTQGIKPIQTEQDREYLEPIFEELYTETIKFTPELNRDIQLYISESMTVNAFAIGRKTIAITRGAMCAFKSDELKGVLSHEFGHMANGDTKALLINVVGNGFFSLIIFVLRFILLFIQNISVAFSNKNIVVAVFAIISFIFRLLVDLGIIVFVFLGNVILALNSRYSELLADKYAFHIGYGEELKNSLYILSKLSLSEKLTFMERLTASHPYTTARIQKLEELGA